MPLVNTADLLYQARQRNYCVGAFNIVDHLTIEAVIQAAEARRSPVIIQTSSGTVRRYGPDMLVAMTKGLAHRSPIPVSLHLDHGTDLQLIRDCISAGYTSVMIDASAYSLQENIRLTRQVVEEAHDQQISVEGEIGVLAGVEDEIVISQDAAIYTTPEEAIAFQKGSGADFVAVAIGTAHGFYKVEPRLDIDTLRTIRDQVDFPLVIHGGSGLEEEVVRTLVAAGASKMNISTQLKKTYLDSLYDYLCVHREEYNPLHAIDAAAAGLRPMIEAYLEILGSAGQA